MTFVRSPVRFQGAYCRFLRPIFTADSFAHVPLPDEPNPYLRQADPDAIPEMFDIPIGLVNQVLFQHRDEDREL